MVSKTKKIILGGAGVTIISILALLLTIQGIIITTSGDITCAGTSSSPCISFFNITSSQYSIKFYNSTQKLSFSPEIESYKIYRYMSGKWKESNFPINITKGVLYQFKIVGIKKNPSDVIKWGVYVGDANVDPIWYGTNTYDDYTITTENHCIRGICQLTLYSGVRYAFEDSIWKNITDARSLKGKEGIDIIVNMDKDFPVEVIDYNYTSITVKLNITSKQTGKDILLQVYDTFNDSIKFLNTTIKSTIPSINSQTLIFGLDKTLKFGFNSTTITLNETNGGNVGDAQVMQYYSTYNYGAGGILAVTSSALYARQTFIRWNMSVIPAGSTITDANLTLTADLPYGGSSKYHVIGAYNTSPMNTTGTSYWNEGTLYGDCGSGVNCNLDRNITWNNKPALGTLQSSYISQPAVGIKFWNVTNAVITAYANTTYPMMSIALANTTDTSDNVTYFWDKEYTTVSQRPQLVITYIAGDTTPPTYSTIGVNNTSPSILDQVLFYVNWADEIGLSGYIYSTNSSGVNCDTWANDSFVAMTGTGNWSNATKQIPATCLGNIAGIGWMVYANDTSNNWNSTPATNSFSVGGAPDINYSFGPALTTQIMFNQPTTCSEEETLSFIYPQNQTGIQGILNLTNNGTATANSFGCVLSSAAPAGYAMMIGNTTGNYTITNTANVTVGSNIAQSATIMAWLYLNCTTPSAIWAPNVDCYVTS